MLDDLIHVIGEVGMQVVGGVKEMRHEQKNKMALSKFAPTCRSRNLGM